MDISSFKRDSKAIQAGQWVENIDGFEDARFRVRGLSSPVVSTLLSAKERKVSKKGRLKDGTIKPEIRRQIFGEVLHEAVLIDWDGLTDGGQVVPYSKELAEKWCTDPDYEPFADAVTYAARIIDAAIEETVDEAGKNSLRSSSGKSSGASEPRG